MGRHLTPTEKLAIAQLLGDAGASEVLITVAAWVQTDVADPVLAERLGVVLRRVARDLGMFTQAANTDAPAPAPTIDDPIVHGARTQAARAGRPCTIRPTARRDGAATLVVFPDGHTTPETPWNGWCGCPTTRQRPKRLDTHVYCERCGHWIAPAVGVPEGAEAFSCAGCSALGFWFPGVLSPPLGTPAPPRRCPKCSGEIAHAKLADRFPGKEKT
jgi:hypothetical protein